MLDCNYEQYKSMFELIVFESNKLNNSIRSLKIAPFSIIILLITIIYSIVNTNSKLDKIIKLLTPKEENNDK